MRFLYMDYYYLVLVVPALLLALIAQFKVKSTFSAYSNIRSQRGLTGEQAARQVLSHYGINDVNIEMVNGKLTDHYDPRDNVIRLSQDVYSSTSIAAIGVACHEAGHAAQHAQGYVPIKIRNAILPICNIGSTLGFPLAIAGIIFSFEPLISIGLLLYALVAVFQFATLPVEFNASSRAIKVIDEAGILNEDEAKGAIKVLKSAAMTYVAALTVSIANLLRLFMLANNRRD
ncbi:MAG: zinc metallopeptidase [Oscillospiraceae bacterium]